MLRVGGDRREQAVLGAGEGGVFCWLPPLCLRAELLRDRRFPGRVARGRRRRSAFDDDGEGLVLLQRLEEARFGGRRVVERADHDAEIGRRQRRRRGLIQARPIDKARCVEALRLAAPEPRHQPEPLGVRRCGRCFAEVVGCELRRGEVLDRAEGGGREPRHPGRVAKVGGSGGVLDGLGDRGQQDREIDVLRDARAAFGEKRAAGQRPRQLVEEHEVDGHVAGVAEDAATQRHAEQVGRNDDSDPTKGLVAADIGDRLFGGRREIRHSGPRPGDRALGR